MELTFALFAHNAAELERFAIDVSTPADTTRPRIDHVRAGGPADVVQVVFDEPVVVHCYMLPEAIEEEANLAKLAAFCRRMGRETNQGEIGLFIADEHLAIRDYTEPET